jgi:acyl-CoA synthetase (AMP-forming)/AMP-acid ligase II
MSALGDRLRRHAREHGDARAVHVRDRWWTYGEVVAGGELLASKLVHRGVRAGDVVAIAIDQGIEAVLAIAAAALIDAVPATVDPRDAPAAAATLGRLRPAIALVSADAPAIEGTSAVTMRAGKPVLAAKAGRDAAAILRPGRISHVIFTSGSTADTKGVVWSEVRAEYDWRLFPPTPMQRAAPAAIVVPLSTSLGLQELLRHLAHGLSVALIEVPFRAGIELLRGLDVNRVKLTPTHAEMLLSAPEELPRLRQIMVAAAPLATPRLTALAARFPGARVGRSYGLTEAGAACALWLHANPGKADTVGRAVANRRVTVRDRHGNVLPPGQVGEVVVDVPMWDAVDGYLDAPPAVARRFRNATLWTGDRGRLDGRGFLTLGPRIAEILKVGGRSVSAPRIEQPLRAGGAEVAVVGVPDAVLGEAPCAVFVPRDGVSAVALAAAAAGGGLREDEVPRWYLPRRALPVNASSKVRRGMLAAEARRWTTAFPAIVVPELRAFPAVEQGGVMLVDGWPDVEPGPGRVIAIAKRSPLALVGLGLVAAGVAGADLPVRYIVGEPRAALARLAELLPGASPVSVICARGAASDGFESLPSRAGWTIARRAGATDELVAAAVAGIAEIEGAAAHLLAGR